MVYLIHFAEKFKGTQHYLGFAVSEATYLRRIQHHRKGTGAAILRAVNKAGIKWSVVREWPDEDGNFERKLKNQKKAWKHCPVCNKVKASLINTVHNQDI